MVLRLLEGFETRQHTTYFSRLYASTSGSFPGFPSGRKGGSSAQSSSFQFTTKPLVASDENVWTVGFAIRKSTVTAVGGASTCGVSLQTAAGSQCSLVMVPGTAGNFKWELRRGATVIATSGEFSWGGTRAWHYFMMQVTVRPGTDGTYELKHFDHHNNETAVFSGSSVNLANQGTDGADRLSVSLNANGPTILLDDLFAMDGSGSLNNDFPSKPAVILGGLPTSDGNQSDWTPNTGSVHYTRVDDPAGAPDDTARVTANTIGDIDLWGYSDFATIGAATPVIGVQIVSTASMVASGSRTLRARVRSGSNESPGDSFDVDVTSLASFRQLWDQNPTGTPAAWTKTSVEAAEFGIEVEA